MPLNEKLLGKTATPVIYYSIISINKRLSSKRTLYTGCGNCM